MASILEWRTAKIKHHFQLAFLWRNGQYKPIVNPVDYKGRHHSGWNVARNSQRTVCFKHF